MGHPISEPRLRQYQIMRKTVLTILIHIFALSTFSDYDCGAQ